MLKGNYDIIIVGCGFAALSLLKSIRGEYRIVVFEEHSTVGYPLHCTGIVSDKAIEYIGTPAKQSIVNSFKSITLYSPLWKSITIDYKRRAIHVLDRVYLEKLLYDNSLSTNTKFHFRERVEKVYPSRKLIITNRSRLVKGSIIVVCEGSQHRILNSILGKNRGWRVHGIQWDVKAKLNIGSDEIIVYFSNTISPNYFSWLVPLSDRVVRVGIGGYKTSIHRLKYVTELFTRRGFMRVYSVGKPFGGIIVLGPPMLRDYINTTIFLGDSGFHTKPFTGGGIFTISLFSSILAKSLLRYSTSLYALKRYHSWSLWLKRKLQVQYIISKLFHSLSDYEKDRLWDLLIQYGVDDILGRSSFDFHEENVKYILKAKNTLLPCILKTIKPYYVVRGLLDLLL